MTPKKKVLEIFPEARVVYRPKRYHGTVYREFWHVIDSGILLGEGTTKKNAWNNTAQCLTNFKVSLDKPDYLR